MPDTLSVADTLDALRGTTHQALLDVVDRAHSLRTVLVVSTRRGADPEELHERLLLCRDVTDKLEDMLGELILMRAKVDQAVADRRGEVEDAEVAANVPKEDYATSRDRSVMLNAATMTERMRLRRAEALQRDMRAAQEYVQLMHRGADSTRRDVEVRLRAVTLTTTLER